MTPPADPEIVSRLPTLPPRAPDSHKGTFGRVLVVAGCRGMTGAAVLCGSAALRGGAGLVQVASPADSLPVVAAGNPCYLTAPLAAGPDGRLAADAEAAILALAREATVVAFGPGLGQNDVLTRLVPALVARIDRPLVLDADGLNNLGPPALGGRSAPTVLTPHPGEFGRLLGVATAEVQAKREELAVRFAHAHGVVLVLKGHRTLVTDGRRLYRNATGNPGMATGGTGDVLTGLIAALIGQGLDAFAAAQLGVHCHGLAGDLARDALGEVSLTAVDVLECLPHALGHIGRT